MVKIMVIFMPRYEFRTKIMLNCSHLNIKVLIWIIQNAILQPADRWGERDQALRYNLSLLMIIRCTNKAITLTSLLKGGRQILFCGTISLC